MSLRDFLLDRRTAFVTRWHHRPCLQRESIAEHQAIVARISYFIASALKESGAEVDPGLVVIRALFHDEPEIITGDLPGDQKRVNVSLRMAAQVGEEMALGELVNSAPSLVRDAYRRAMKNVYGLEAEIVKYADDLAALAFLEDEIRMGNRVDTVRDTRDNIRRVIGERDWDWLCKLEF